MKKKIGSLIMAMVLACTMVLGVAFTTGCNGGGGSTGTVTNFEMPEGGFDVNKPVTIKFYHSMGQSLKKVLENYIEQFNQIYPNITVEEESLGNYNDIRDKVVTELQGKKSPSLTYCYPDHVAIFNQSKAVLPLNDFLPDGAFKDMKVPGKDGKEEPLGFTQEQVDDFIDCYYEEGYQYDDGTKMYSLPFAKSTEVLFYNKTFFEKNNLTVPTTWDEMEQVCAKIKEISEQNERTDVIPLGYDSEANWFITMCEQYGSPYTSLEGEKFQFDNAKNREFVKKFKGWYDKGYFTTQEMNKTYTSNLFKEEKSYMCIGSSAGASYQAPGKVDGEYKFEVGIAPMPQVDPSNPKVISQGPSICLFKKEDPQEVLASWLFAKFLTTNVGFQAQFSSVNGYAPVLESAKENPVYKEFLDNADGFANLTYLSAKVCTEQENAYYTSPAFFGSSKARTEVGKLLQAVYTFEVPDGKNPDEEIDKKIDEAFKEAIEECKYYVGE